MTVLNDLIGRLFFKSSVSSPVINRKRFCVNYRYYLVQAELGCGGLLLGSKQFQVMILPPKKQLWKWSKLAHRNHLANFTKVQSNCLIDSVAARKNTFFKIPSSLSPRTGISNSHCPTYKMSDNPKLTYFCFIQKCASKTLSMVFVWPVRLHFYYTWP